MINASLISDAVGRRNRRGRSAFTLIEILVVIFLILVLAVILIFVIAAAFGDAKVKATNENAKLIHSSVEQLNAKQRSFELFDMSNLKKYAGSAFMSECGLPSTGKWDGIFAKNKEAAKKMSKILCFVLGPQKDDWDRAMKDQGTGSDASREKARQYAPIVAESQSRGLVNRDAENQFAYFVDGWGTPFLYKFDLTAGGGPDSFPPIVLISAGPDEEFGTEDDLELHRN